MKKTTKHRRKKKRETTGGKARIIINSSRATIYTCNYEQLLLLDCFPETRTTRWREERLK